MERPAWTRPTLSPIKAWQIRREGLKIAKEMGIEQGAIRIGGRHKLIRFQGNYGDAAPAYRKIAGKKLTLVLDWRRSVSLQQERMASRGQHISDLGGIVPINVIGGVAIRDRKGRFLGGASFSGGKPEQDQEVVRRAIEKVGLQTDLSK